MTAQLWLAIRLEIIGNLIIFFAAFFAVLAKDQSPDLVRLSITYSMQVTIVIFGTFLYYSVMERNFCRYF